MFDRVSVTLARPRSDEPRPAEALPWQVVVLLICFAAVAVVLAILYPDVFGSHLEQF